MPGSNLKIKTIKSVCCILISALIITSSHAQTENKELSHYIFPEFSQGLILMKIGENTKAMMNYNSLTEEMIFENKGEKLAVPLKDFYRIDTVYIKGRKFIPLNNQFVEIVYDSNWDLLVEHKCDLNQTGKPVGYGSVSKTTAVNSYSSFASDGMVYELKLPAGYETRPYVYYWLRKDGEVHIFKSMRELKKLYEEKEDLFKPYVKQHDVKYENQESIIQLIEYLETN